MTLTEAEPHSSLFRDERGGNAARASVCNPRPGQHSKPTLLRIGIRGTHHPRLEAAQ